VRDRAYWLFALVAWPAAVWGVVELGLRAMSGYGDGIGESLLLTVAAAGTILVTGWRRRELSAAVDRA